MMMMMMILEDNTKQIQNYIDIVVNNNKQLQDFASIVTKDLKKVNCDVRKIEVDDMFDSVFVYLHKDSEAIKEVLQKHGFRLFVTTYDLKLIVYSRKVDDILRINGLKELLK